jgi:putative tricarboxylic transport membrane protein
MSIQLYGTIYDAMYSRRDGNEKGEGVRNRGDLIGSVLLILTGIGVIIESIRLKIGTLRGPQPGFFPFVGSILLIALALVLLIRSWRGGEASDQPREAFGELRRPVILVVGMGVYAGVLDPIGYLISTLLIAAVVLRVLGVRSWKVISLGSLSLSLGTYLLFDRILGIDLPPGVLEGLL